MNSITITYGSTTQTIEEWGFTYCTLHLRSRAASTMILDTAGGDPAAAAAIPYGGWITAAISMGDGSTYYFVGKRRDFNARAWPAAPVTAMLFEDVWGALERTIFQHYWSMSNGSGGLTNKYFSRLNLFQDISAGPTSTWAYLTADKQIEQIIDFAQTQCSLPVQYGEVDPVWNMPVFAVKAISCAYALQLVLKPMPDMVTSMDYSTSPPTIHFLARQNCAPVTLPFAGTDAFGRHHKQTDIKPRPDLQVPAVVVQYQITGTYDGVNYNDVSVDAYPAGSTGLEENAMVVPVDLRGPGNTILKATLKTVAIDPASTTFWQTIKPDLNDPNIVFDATTPIVDTTINGGSGHPDGITILDGSGAEVDLTDYPNKLLPSGGQIAPWMLATGGGAIEAVPVTIRATLKYVKNFPGTTPPTTVEKVDKHVVECRVTLTNAPAGTTSYTTVGSATSGDPIPVHLAYFIWCSVNNVAVNYVDGVATPPETAPSLDAPENLQWEGEHVITEDTIYSIITPANTLNISGGNSDWETMNAAIYAVDYDFFKGTTTIQFGPHKHLQAAEYFEMVMSFRYRSVWNNPSLRNNGAQAASGAQLSSASYKENTTHQNPQQQKHTVVSKPSSGNVIQIQSDTTTNGGQLLIQTVNASGVVQTSPQPQVQLSQSDLGTVDDDGVTGRIAKWRKFVVLDATTGEPYQVMLAASAEEDTDVTVSGANVVIGKLTAVYDNYIVITDITNSENVIRAAKSYKLRNSVTSEITLDGTTWSFTYESSGAIAYVARTKTTTADGGYSEYQRVTPVYQVASGETPADQITVVQLTNTQATDLNITTISADEGVETGTLVTYLEIGPPRVWAKKIDQTTP